MAIPVRRQHWLAVASATTCEQAADCLHYVEWIEKMAVQWIMWPGQQTFTATDHWLRAY